MKEILFDKSMTTQFEELNKNKSPGKVIVSRYPGITKGSCIVLENGHIIYGGPITEAPGHDGTTSLLHPDDYADFILFCAERHERTTQ